VTVPHTEPLNITGYSNNYANKPLKIASFLDERKENYVTFVGQYPTVFEGSVTGVVQDQITQLLKGKGFEISNKSKRTLLGAVKVWRAEVVPGMSGSVNAVAKIGIDLKDVSGRKIYTGVYEGSSFISNTQIGEQDLRVALGAAMLEAVEQAGSDKRLLDLASYTAKD